ncbi:hypothetical protein ACP3WJ_24565, partial [Salmonella enterica]|uniref:hypothetical protein n=1 Tax=Salmonella enterica TaxID=28901 RepID=UPI003CF2D7F9
MRVEVDRQLDVFTTTFSILSLPAYILFNLGESLYFVSTTFIDRASLSPSSSVSIFV